MEVIKETDTTKTLQVKVKGNFTILTERLTVTINLGIEDIHKHSKGVTYVKGDVYEV